MAEERWEVGAEAGAVERGAGVPPATERTPRASRRPGGWLLRSSWLIAALVPAATSGQHADVSTAPAAAVHPLSREAAIEEFRAVARTGGYWAAANEERFVERGEPTEYRMRYWLSPEGSSLGGCLWANEGPGATRAFWRFFHAWDPSTRTVLAYQEAPSGAVVVGAQGAGPDGSTETIQSVHLPGRPAVRVRHVNVWVHADTLDSRSYMLTDGAWVLQRNDIWIWRETDEPGPCR